MEGWGRVLSPPQHRRSAQLRNQGREDVQQLLLPHFCSHGNTERDGWASTRLQLPLGRRGSAGEAGDEGDEGDEGGEGSLLRGEERSLYPLAEKHLREGKRWCFGGCPQPPSPCQGPAKHLARAREVERTGGQSVLNSVRPAPNYLQPGFAAPRAPRAPSNSPGSKAGCQGLTFLGL